MHLPFNEGYIRVLRSNYPSAKIHFYCNQGHISKLASSCDDLKDITFSTCASLKSLSDNKIHNPFNSYLGVKKALNFVKAETMSIHGTFAIAFAGFTGMLLRCLKTLKINGQAPTTHCILHNDLAANFDWRSRNPLIKRFDLISTLGSRLRKNLKIVALELGIKDSMLEHFPHLDSNIFTLEHPILSKECQEGESLESKQSSGINIGFVGHCSDNKGFGTFLELAEMYSNEHVTFHAIGLMQKDQDEALLCSLSRPPSRKSVPRDEYVAAVSEMDVICLPVAQTYNLVASGSVLDAITSLKPLILTKNKSYIEMEKKYGSFGVLYNDTSVIKKGFSEFLSSYVKNYPQWKSNIAKIRSNRIAENIKYSF